MSSWFDFKALRAQLDFAQVLRFYGVELNIKEDQHLGVCPLPTHQSTQNSPSFSAALKKGVWRCFGCGAQGNLYDFAIHMEGLDPKQGRNLYSVACKLKRQFVNTDGVSRPTKKASLKGPIEGQQDLFPHKQAKNEINAPLDFELKELDAEHPYLKQRGFTIKTMEHFGVGYCSRGLLKDRIAIPLHCEQGRLIGYAGRTIDDNSISSEHPKYKFPSPRERKGVKLELQKSLILYNSHRISGPVHDVIVVQGFPSVWHLWQAGFPNAVALMGADCSERQAELIVSKTKPEGCVWIMPSHTSDGLICASNLLNLLAPYRRIRWVKIKEGSKPLSYSADDLKDILRCEEPSQSSNQPKRSGRSIKARLMSGEIQARHAIVELANSFSGLRKLELKAESWDASALDVQSGRFSSGERAAIQFILSVWNGHQEWQSGVFDVVSAMDTWDSHYREAFLSWASDPWWA